MDAQLEKLLAKRPWEVKPSDVMKRFAELVRASWSRKVADGDSIVFDMVHEIWTYDPTNRALVQQCDTPSAALRICAQPSTLMDALNDPNFKVDPYRVVTIGDWSAMATILDALRTNQSVLALRASLKSRT